MRELVLGAVLLLSCSSEVRTSPSTAGDVASSSSAGGAAGSSTSSTGANGGAGAGELDLCTCLTAIFGDTAGDCYACAVDQQTDACMEAGNICAVDPFCSANRGGAEVAYSCVTACSTPACRLDCVTEKPSDQEAITRGKRHFRDLATCMCAQCTASCTPAQPVICEGP